MATVNVNTQTLISGGNSITNYLSKNESYYNSIKSISMNNCSAFDNFKNKLNTQFNTYTNHCEKASSKLIECANELENVDNSIGNMLQSKSESLTTGTKTASTSDYSLSGDLDYTFDSSNVGISVDELYAKAQIIKDSELPVNIKVVKTAKLLHEYTFGWTWDRNRLSYADFRSTLEMPTKTIVCATGVSDALYLAGAVETIGNQAGTFNPNYQTNILITAQKKGWQRIDSSDFDQLQPGDIIFTKYNGHEYGHVEIYAGNGYAYSWGNNSAMADESPKSVTVAEYQSLGSCAYRITTSEDV